MEYWMLHESSFLHPTEAANLLFVSFETVRPGDAVRLMAHVLAPLPGPVHHISSTI
jgi:hypothetical protein